MLHTTTLHGNNFMPHTIEYRCCIEYTDEEVSSLDFLYPVLYEVGYLVLEVYTNLKLTILMYTPHSQHIGIFKILGFMITIVTFSIQWMVKQTGLGRIYTIASKV